MDLRWRDDGPSGGRAPGWIIVAALLFLAVAAVALWQGWSHRDGGPHGPPPVVMRDVIRAHGGGAGSVR